MELLKKHKVLVIIALVALVWYGNKNGWFTAKPLPTAGTTETPGGPTPVTNASDPDKVSQAGEVK